MILILSEENDHSTNDVIDWLLLFEIDFLRINDNEIIEIKEIKITNQGYDILFKLKLSSEIYSIKQFSSYWYRRGNIVLDIPIVKNGSEISPKIEEYLKNENYKLKDFFIKELDKIPNKIGSIFNLNKNKLSNLVLATKVGMKIPNTKILTEKLNLKSNLKEKYISKAIYNNFDVFNNSYHISSYTSLIENNYDLLGNKLFPSLVQEFIDKLIDVRVFYLKGKIWSAAIFSQNDEKTKIDFRNYNYEKPNRIESIELPEVLKKSIVKFMTDLNLDSGSLDFVLSKQQEYFFLEVNPVGQFGAISFACGFNIEKEIAMELIKK
jgi:ATP-GRASP peptide maturase of grasp-with-spasm system